MDTVGIYIREIRVGRGFTQESLAERVGVSKRTIERLERNEGEITVSTFEQIVAAIRASAEQIHQLATNATIPVETAKEMARKWLHNNTDNQIAEVTAQIRAEGKVAEALALIQQLQNDPAAIDRLLGYGQSLLDAHRRR